MGKQIFKILFILLLSATSSQLSAIELSSEEIGEFSNSREWKVALQYWKNVFGETVSRIDEQKYFFSAYGHHNPEAELRKFIDKLLHSSDINEIACKYPARFRVVDERFSLVGNGLVKAPNCERLNNWKDSLGRQSLSVIFPSAYLNNPASMYGHTFIRFNTKEGSRDALLAYGASFGANTGEDGGVA